MDSFKSLAQIHHVCTKASAAGPSLTDEVLVHPRIQAYLGMPRTQWQDPFEGCRSPHPALPSPAPRTLGKNPPSDGKGKGQNSWSVIQHTTCRQEEEWAPTNPMLGPRQPYSEAFQQNGAPIVEGCCQSLLV